MLLKTAVHELTQRLHRLGWRTDQAVTLLAQWRTNEITRREFTDKIEDLLRLDHEELTSDELADLELFRRIMAAILEQQK